MNHAKTVQQCSYFSKLPSHKKKHDFLILPKTQPSTKTVTQEKQQLRLEEGFKGQIYCIENRVRVIIAGGKLTTMAKPNCNNSCSKTVVDHE